MQYIKKSRRSELLHMASVVRYPQVHAARGHILVKSMNKWRIYHEWNVLFPV